MSCQMMVLLCVQFNKDSGKAVEECKLRVVYVSPQPAEEALKELKQNIDSSSVSFSNCSLFLISLTVSPLSLRYFLLTFQSMEELFARP